MEAIYLVRKYTTNGEKQNITVKTFDKALEAIGRGKEEIYNTVDWLHITDYFFRDTKDYIRETKIGKI